MAKYLARPCPRCNGYLGIVLREPRRNKGLRGVCGHCFRCHHRLAWTLIRGKALFPTNVEEKKRFISPALTWGLADRESPLTVYLALTIPTAKGATKLPRPSNSTPAHQGID